MEIRVYALDIDSLPGPLRGMFDTIKELMTNDEAFVEKIGFPVPVGYSEAESRELREAAVFAWVQKNLGEEIATMQATVENLVTEPTKH